MNKTNNELASVKPSSPRRRSGTPTEPLVFDYAAEVAKRRQTLKNSK